MTNNEPTDKTPKIFFSAKELTLADLSALILNPTARAEWVKKAQEAGCGAQAEEMLAMVEKDGPKLQDALELASDMLRKSTAGPGAEKGYTALEVDLLRALTSGNLAMAEKLLSDDGAPNTATLFRDVVKGQPELAQTLLFMGVGLGSFKAVKALLAAGAKPNATGPNGMTPLTVATTMQRRDMAELLKSAGATK